MPPFDTCCAYTLAPNETNVWQITLLGSGTGGGVHMMVRAHSRHKLEFFARKVLLLYGGTTLDDIKNEIKAVEKLRSGNFAHQNLVQILCHGELRDPDHPFYIDMELCDIDLKEYIYRHKECRPLGYGIVRSDQHSLPLRDQPSYVWQIMKQISCGIAFMHQHKQVHRDLKPANILYSFEKQLWKVADFGYVSKCSSDKLQDIASGNSRGTVGFRAPELQHTAAPTYNAFSDIWSMGCILYELAFGKKAFEDDWQARRIAESDKSLEYPVDSLGSWDPTSKEALAKLLDRMLDRMAIMRPPASNLSDIFEKLSGYAAATDRPHSAPLSERPETLLDSHSPPAIPARETDMPEQHADENAAVGSLEVRSPPPNPAMETNIRISGQRPDTEQRLIPETVTDSLEVQSQSSMDAMDSNIHFADYANTQDGIIPFQTVFDSLTVQSEPPIDPVLLVGYGHNSPESNSTDSNTPLDTEMPDADENSDLGSINQSPFTCPKCKYSFKREPDLRRHLETVHVQQDNWCNHCPKDEAKRYARHDGLMRHIKEKHPQTLADNSEILVRRKNTPNRIAKLHARARRP